jgi:arsenite methyltransferase
VAELTNAHYGLDAPAVVVGNAVGGTAALAGAAIAWAAGRQRHRVPAAVLAGWLAAWGTVAVAQAGLMVRSSRAGKLRERDRLLDDLPWRGDEWVLDIGCGRGLLLIGAAKRLTTGRAIGLDLWRTQDQAGNDPVATMANAIAEGVAQRVELCDGDARRLPFDDHTFDVVVSSLAVHNIPGALGRAAAIDEIARVLKPGGHVALLDFRNTSHYATALATAGLDDVHRTERHFGMYPPVRVVTAAKAVLDRIAARKADPEFQNEVRRAIKLNQRALERLAES